MGLVVKTLNGVIYHEKPPNGGWGWVVMMAAFLIYGNAFGTSKSLGIYFLSIKFEFGLNNSTTSWMSSLFLGALGLAGLFTNILLKWFDSRKVLMIGGFLACLGLVIAAYSPNVILIFIGCFLSGTGHGIGFVCSTGQVSLYFGSLRPLANGIMLSGSSVLSTVMPYFNNYLLKTYGWRGSFLLLGGMGLNSCVMAALIRPIENISKSNELLDKDRVLEVTEKSTENISVVVKPQHRRSCGSFLSTYWVALCLLSAMVTLDLCLFVPNIYIVPYAKMLGYTDENGAMLLSFISIGDIICRPICGFLITKFELLKQNLLLFLTLLNVLMAFNQIVASLGTAFGVLLFYTIVHGCLYGVMSTTSVTAVPTLMGTKNINQIYGIFFASGSFSILASGPIAGALVDTFGNYNVAFWYSMVCLATTGLICLIMHVIIKIRGGIVLEKHP